MAHYPTDHRRGVSAGKAGVGVQVSEADTRGDKTTGARHYVTVDDQK